jgi:hypothetical protein
MASSTRAGRVWSSRPAELFTVVRYFRQALGWPVEVSNNRLILRTGDTVDAFVLPNVLGQQVAAELATSMMDGPAYTDGRWWTFITERCRRANLEIPAELRQARVWAVPRGGHVVLPHPADQQSWSFRPEPGHAVPPWSVVVALARKVLHRQI